MNIMLIFPGFADLYGKYKNLFDNAVGSFPPLGIGYLAASLVKNGHKVKITDMEPERKGIHDILLDVKSFDAELVGISATSPLAENANLIAKEIKEHFNLPTIIGGVHATIVGREALEDNSSFDFAMRGESENNILKFVDSLQGKIPFSSVNGLIYRDGSEIIENARNDDVDVDQVSFPDRTRYNQKLYKASTPKMGIQRATSFLTSRGCPYDCAYCSENKIFGRRIKFRSTENVLEELEYIVRTLGTRYVYFMDDTITIKKDRILEICELILKNGLEFGWEATTRADRVDLEILEAMKRAGMQRISFGIESGAQEILDALNRGMTIEQIEEACSIAKKVGLEVRGTAMIGSPYETRETIDKSIERIKNIKGLDICSFYISVPYPGSKLRQMALNGEGGVKLLDTSYSALSRFDGITEVNGMCRDELNALLRKAYLRVHLTPRRVVNLVKRRGFTSSAREGFSFLKANIPLLSKIA